jgi:Holliday junction DNA helicase RuvA
MISRISGILREIKESIVVVDVGGICYTLSVSGWTLERLRSQSVLDQPVELFTLHYIEGNVGMGNLTPRLVGFSEEIERDFFEIFTTVKGLGIRKALSAMIHPVDKIAAAIETGDKDLLRQLPEIGPRTADRVVAEIKGKMAPFVQIREGEAITAQPVEKSDFSFQDEAKEVLLQLGYKKNEIDRMIRDTLTTQPQIDKADELVQAVFRQQIPHK